MSRVERTVDEICLYGHLKENWDTYDARPITPIARLVATKLALVIDPAGGSCPSVDGGITLELDDDEIVCITISPDGEVGIDIAFDDMPTPTPAREG